MNAASRVGSVIMTTSVALVVREFERNDGDMWGNLRVAESVPAHSSLGCRNVGHHPSQGVATASCCGPEGSAELQSFSANPVWWEKLRPAIPHGKRVPRSPSLI